MANLKHIDLMGIPRSDLLALVKSITLDEDQGFYLERRGADAWCITNGTSVLNSDFELECEPMPSAREEAFIARTRFTLEAAQDHWNAYASLNPMQRFAF